MAIGALTAEPYPRPGVRAHVTTISAGLGDLLELAAPALVDGRPLRAAERLCLCQAP